MNILKQVDDFWREAIQLDIMDNWKLFETKYTDFVRRIGDQVSHLPDEEQARLIRQVIARNSEYIALANRTETH